MQFHHEILHTTWCEATPSRPSAMHEYRPDAYESQRFQCNFSRRSRTQEFRPFVFAHVQFAVVCYLNCENRAQDDELSWIALKVCE
jgi:hypothetical protein